MHTNKAPFLAIAWMAIATCSVVVIVKAQTSGFQHYCLEHSAPQGSYVCVESRDGLIIQLQPSSNAYVQPGETVDYHERFAVIFDGDYAQVYFETDNKFVNINYNKDNPKCSDFSIKAKHENSSPIVGQWCTSTAALLTIEKPN